MSTNNCFLPADCCQSPPHWGPYPIDYATWRLDRCRPSITIRCNDPANTFVESRPVEGKERTRKLKKEDEDGSSKSRPPRSPPPPFYCPLPRAPLLGQLGVVTPGC